MKRAFTLPLALVMVFGLPLVGCKQEGEATKVEPAKSEPKAEPTKTEPAKTEPAKTEPAKTEPAKTEPAKAEAKGEGTPEENCGAAYDFAKQMVEAFAKKLGKAATKEMPPRDKYVAACKQLPPAVARCMNPKVAMSEAQKCGEEMAKAKDQVEKIRALMKK